jgi:rhodanese-related sulfurtransferase
MAAKLRQLTPRTYQCGLDSFAPKSSTRQVTDIAFQPEQKKLKEDVDMSEWLRKESRSMAGKIFWYHTASGKTQWEHPAEGITPPPMSFALPISIEEVASMSNGSSSSIHYFIVDCRGLRSSEELKCGRIPAAYTLDPSVFDSPDLIAKNLQAFEPIKNETHIVLVGDGIAMPLCLVEPSEDFKIKVRDAVRADRDRINQATLFFQKQGFKYVSILDGGFASWHAYMRDTPGQNPSELLGHDGEVCNYCRYDIWLQTGEDPLKNGPSSSGGSVTGGFFQRRKKKISMPATTSLPVNGGEGSDCIISTSTLSRDRSSSGSISSSSRASAELDDLFGMSSSNQMDGTRPSFSGATSSLSLAVSTSVRRSINSLPRGSMKTLKLKVSSKWSNTFHWPRKNSSTSATQSCFEGEDNNSSEKTQEENGEENQVEETSTKEEPQQKQEVPKPFIGVFTIDYSDDEEEEEINNQEVSDQHVASTMTASH